MRVWLARGAALAAVAFALTTTGCGAEDSCTGAACDGGRSDTRTDAPQFDGSLMDVPRGDSGDPSQRELASIEIAPAAPSIVSTSAMPRPTLAFTATGVRRDGTRIPLATGVWSLEHDRLGTIDGAGVFTANGVGAGQLQVRYEAPGPSGTTLMAQTTLTVRVERTLLGEGVMSASTGVFALPGIADPARAATVRYPLNNAFMPNNVAPPDVQWAPIGNPGDLFRVTIAKPNVSITSFLSHSGGAFRHDWQVDRESWRSVAESDRDALATVTIDRWDAAAMQVVSGDPIRVRLAHGSIFGVVYYWNLERGRLQRINAVTAALEDFMPNPPRRPGDGAQCVACHTISRDGNRLSAEMWGGDERSTVFDLTADLNADPAPTAIPIAEELRYLFSSFSPDGSRLVTNRGNAFGLVDPRSGMSVAAVGLPTSNAAHPEWSPDGRHIAMITNTNGTWAVDFTNGDLALIDAGAGDTFAPPRVIHAGASLTGSAEGGAVDSHPTWSPDSRYVAFAHGTDSRSGNGAADYPGALYLAAADGSRTVRLDNANGGAAESDSYWPTFSPFTTVEPGESTSYFWLAFFSRRDYGNEIAGTRGSNRRQLWVTAINLNAAPGTDPSGVPYWLPGQAVASQNMAAQWAPQPCRMNGLDCRTSTDCCSGRCNAMGRCEPPPPSECRREGMSCGVTGDCCRGLECMGNVCGAPPG